MNKTNITAVNLKRGCGNTTACIETALNALKHNKKVLFITTEETVIQIYERMRQAGFVSSARIKFYEAAANMSVAFETIYAIEEIDLVVIDNVYKYLAAIGIITTQPDINELLPPTLKYFISHPLDDF